MNQSILDSMDAADYDGMGKNSDSVFCDIIIDNLQAISDRVLDVLPTLVTEDDSTFRTIDEECFRIYRGLSRIYGAREEIDE